MSPAVILVPGICCLGSEVYATLVQELQKVGFPHIETADIEKIRSVISAVLAASKEDVVVVAHSYGGGPALYACEGLWKAARQGGESGVLRVLLISSALPLPGHTVGGDRAEYGSQEDAGGAEIRPVEDELVLFPGKDLVPVWFNDVAEEDRKQRGDQLRSTVLGAVMSPAPSADVDLWKMSYLLTTGLDLVMPEGFQKHLVQRAQEEGAEVTTEEIKSGHFVQVTHAPEVADWIKRICQL